MSIRRQTLSATLLIAALIALPLSAGEPNRPEKL